MSSILDSWRHGVLTAVLALVVLLTSPVSEAGHELWVMVVSAVAVIGVCILAVGDSDRMRRLVLVLAAFGLAGEVLVPATGWTALVILVRATFIAVVAIVAAAVLARILRPGRVTGDAILGGISVYLLIGLLFSSVFGLVEYLQPGSFVQGGVALDATSDERNAGRYPQLLYYSFVTLTTLGYGDITPTWALPQMLSAVEAVVGQLYIAILIAGLVGMRLSQRRSASDR